MDITVPVVLQEVNIVSTSVRLLLAVLCGGILGIERGRKRRPAGFRTYMLVCVGSALVMITNQYIEALYNTGDPARMGAQVISGIGFLGAGTIVVTGRNRVKGLTTAAGLWAAACIGLTIGVGYYAGAIAGCVVIFICMALMHSLDNWVMSSTKVINLYVEFSGMSEIGAFMEHIRGDNMKISDLEMIRPYGVNDAGIAILCTLRLEKKRPHTEIITYISHVEGVRFAEEI